MSEKRPNPLQDQMRKFSRVEKAFYGSIILTAIILAVSIVFMQTKLLQVDRDLTEVNTQIEAEQTELADIKQEVNELTGGFDALFAANWVNKQIGRAHV